MQKSTKALVAVGLLLSVLAVAPAAEAGPARPARGRLTEVFNRAASRSGSSWQRGQLTREFNRVAGGRPRVDRPAPRYVLPPPRFVRR